MKQLFIKLPNRPTITIDLKDKSNSRATLSDLKHILARKIAIPAEEYFFSINGRVLRENIVLIKL